MREKRGRRGSSGRREGGRGGRGEGDAEKGCEDRDGRRAQGAVTGRREENWDGAEQGPDPAPGPGPGSRGAEEAGLVLGGPRHQGRVGVEAGAPRAEGRGLGLPRGGRGRGGGAGPRRSSLPPRGGCEGGGAPAVAADGPTDGQGREERRQPSPS